MALPYSSGWQRLTTSGVVGVSGSPLLFSGYTFESGGTAGIPYFNSGTAASNVLSFRGGGGVISGGSTIQSVGQLPTMYTTGLYVSFDANTTAVTVFYTQG
jgi:hypothetical protein